MGGRILKGLLALLLVVAVVLAAALWWLGTGQGLRYVLERSQEALAATGQSLVIEGVSGSLYRGVRADRFEWHGDGTSASGTGLVASWSLAGLLSRHLIVPELAVRSLAVRLPPPREPAPPPEPTAMPGPIGLPLTLSVQHLAVGELRIIPGAPPDRAGESADIVVTDIAARLAYRDDAFRIDDLHARTPYGDLSGAHVGFGGQPPHPLTVEAHLDGAAAQVGYQLALAAQGDLERLEARLTGTVAEAPVDAVAALAPLAVMPLTTLSVEVARLDLRLLAEAAPTTRLDARLELAPRAGGDDWGGTIAVRNPQAGSLADGRLPLEAFDASIGVLAAQDPVARELRLDELVLALPGTAPEQGRIRGSLAVAPGRQLQLAGAELPEVRAQLAFEALDLAGFAAGLPPTALDGHLDVDRDRFMLALAQSEARLRDLVPAATRMPPGDAEVRVHGRLDAAALHLAEARLRLGDTRLEASGEATLAEPYRIDAKGTVARLRPGQWLPEALAADPRLRDGVLNGTWTIAGRVAPGFDSVVTLELADSTLAGKPLSARVRSRVALAQSGAPRRVEEADGQIRLGDNRLRVRGGLGQPADRLAIELALADLAEVEPRLEGKASLSGELAGSFDSLRAKATLTAERIAMAAEGDPLRIGSLRIDADLPATGEFAPRSAVDVGIRLRAVQAAGRELSSVELKTRGTVAAHRFELAGAGEGQTLRVAGDGEARLGDSPSWRARIASAVVDGAVPARLVAPATVRVDARDLLVERFALAVAGGEAALDRLALRWGDAFRLETRGRASGLPIERLLELAGSDAGFDALRATRLDAGWNLAGTGADDLSGTASLTLREEGAGGGPLRLEGDNGVQLTLAQGRLDGRFALALPSLAFTHPLTAPDLVLDGSLELRGKVAGTLARPLWDATVTGADLAVLQRSVGWRLTDGSLDARLEGRALQLRTLRFASGDGSVSLRGEARLLDKPRPSARPAAPAPSTAPFDGRFELTAAQLQVPIGPGQRVALSGTTVLASGDDGLGLSGKLRVDRGIIEIQGSSAPSLPDDVRIVNPVGAQPAEEDKPAQSGKPLRVASDLAVDLGDKLRVTGNGVAARLAGSLQVRGTLPDAPRLTGAIDIVDGTYQAYGQNLRIEKGVVRFNGPVDNPALDLLAKRPFLPVEVGVSVTGTVLNPVIALVSSPEMSDTDKLAWLVLGTDPKNAPSAAQSLALRQAAQQLFLKDDGRHKPGVAERLGLDVMNFGYGSDTGQAEGVKESRSPTGLPGSQSNSTASAAQQEVVTLGKRIGSRLFVSYEQGVRGLYNLLRIQYALSQRLAVRAQSGSDNAVDLLYSYAFD